MSVSVDPCPCELDRIGDCISPVEDDEIVVKVVVLKDHLVVDSHGKVSLTYTAISKEDLAKKNGRNGKPRSVSTFRNSLTPPEELKRRASRLNKEPSWENNPILASAHTGSLRSITTKDSYREICVYAEPTGGDDPLGPCTSHAGIVRSFHPPDSKELLEWLVLRTQVASCFSEVLYCYSQASVGKEIMDEEPFLA